MPELTLDPKVEIASEAAGLRGITFNRALANQHVLRPQHVENIISSRGLEEGIVALKVPFSGAAATTLGFNTEGFVKDLNAALNGQTAGFVMELRQHGAAIASSTGGAAHLAVDGTEAWNSSVRMHVASCSKLVTAMAMSRCLAAHGLTPDTKILAYLPKYWAKGTNIDKITFRHLMTHTSGFHVETSASDYGFMKSQVAGGVEPAFLGKYKYENMNFGLCRLAISIMNGNIAADHAFPAATQDTDWDFFTIQAYATYVAQNVFSPAGVQGPTLDHPAPDALAYAMPATNKGWNSGDLKTMAGGAAWHISASELLNVMGNFRRNGNVLSVTAAQQMLDDGLGIDLIQDTPLGKLYNKNGLWQNGSGQVEQSLAYFLPKDMELVVLANSPIGAANAFFRDVVTQIYVKNIGPEFSNGTWRARHGLSGAQYQEAFNNYVGNHGMQLVDVSGYGSTGDRYAALWVKNANAPAWQARHGLSAAQYQQTFDQMNAQGYSPVVVSGYDAGNGQAHYAAIFQKGRTEAWQARHGLNAAQYQQTFNDMNAQGYTLDWVDGYSVNGSALFAAIWRKLPGGPAWQARHGLTAAQHQAFFDQMVQQHFKPVVVSGYNEGGQAKYASIFRQIANAPAWQARHGLTGAQYQQTFDQLVGQGYRLEQVNGYTVGGQDLYAAIWTK